MSKVTDWNAKEMECSRALKAQLKPDDYPDKDDADWLNDTTFLRFVRARDADPRASFELLQKSIAWRKEYKPYKITKEELAGILSLGTVYMAGTCKAGRPILVMTPGLQNPYPAEVRVRLMLYLLEQTYREGHDQVTWIFDWSKFGQRAKDEESSKTRQQVTQLLQDYYPERLGALYMLDTPWFFTVIATLIWPFINKRTRGKIHWTNRKGILQYVDEEELVDTLGGKLPCPVKAQPPPLATEEELAESHQRHMDRHPDDAAREHGEG